MIEEEEVEREKSNNEEKKKTRRTRKDEEGRNFTCPCGKSYLSYPALYTHVKTKHQGKVLFEYMKTPKDEPNNGVEKIEADDENETKDSLIQIQELCEKYFPGDEASSYPTPLSDEAINYIKERMNNWEEIKDTRAEDLSMNQSETIDNIFGKFASEMKVLLKSEAFTYICEFIWYLKEHILENKKDLNFCKDNTGTNFPYFFNEFIGKRLSLGIQKGSPLLNTTLVCKTLYFFGLWIFEQRFTNFSIKFNVV